MNAKDSTWKWNVSEHLADPLWWERPRRIFVNSVSDLFHESLTNEQIAVVFGVMAAAAAVTRAFSAPCWTTGCAFSRRTALRTRCLGLVAEPRRG